MCFAACGQHIRCLWGRVFAKAVLYFSSEVHKNGSNKDWKIYCRPAERERFDAGAARRKAWCDQQNHFPLGERSFPNKRILETIHETPACVKGITIEYYIF